MRSLRSVGWLLLLIPGLAYAGSGLSWATQEKEITAKAGDTEVHADFTCVNKSVSPITLSDLDTGCECTTAHAERKVLGPGETGIVHIDVNLSRITGTQEESVDVYVNGATTHADELRLKVTVPEAYRLTPTLLLWKVGQEPVEQAIHIEPVDRHAVRVDGVHAVSNEFGAAMAAVAVGKAYEVRIRPASTRQQATVPVEIELSVDGKRLTAQVFVVIASD